MFGSDGERDHLAGLGRGLDFRELGRGRCPRSPWRVTESLHPSAEFVPTRAWPGVTLSALPGGFPVAPAGWCWKRLSRKEVCPRLGGWGAGGLGAGESPGGWEKPLRLLAGWVACIPRVLCSAASLLSPGPSAFVLSAPRWVPPVPSRSHMTPGGPVVGHGRRQTAAPWGGNPHTTSRRRQGPAPKGGLWLPHPHRGPPWLDGGGGERGVSPGSRVWPVVQRVTHRWPSCPDPARIPLPHSMPAGRGG